MQQLINELPEANNADYLLDTCFFVDIFEKNKVKELESFCKSNKVGMSTFNLQELINIHHRLHGTVNHHIRNFLKEKLICKISIDIMPGEKEKEREYVDEFDDKILKAIRDPSDALLFVLAIKKRANIITKDKHHIFTVIAENIFNEWKEKILNGFPK